MKKDKDDDIVVMHELAFDDHFTDITLRTKTDRPVTFEEYKSIIYDLIHDCDTEGKDLFLGDDGDTLLN